MTNLADDNEQDKQLSEQDNSAASVVWQRIVVRHTTVWRPPTDIYKTADRLIVLIEIAGIRNQDFHIVLQDRRLIVSGTRQYQIGPEHTAVHQMEIQRGNFRTEVTIPWRVEREQITATYQDGLLRIEIPQAPPRPIHIIDISGQEDT
jgi:HSP20 family protein